MTPQKRREWARVLLSARRHGLGGLKLILFSVACAREVGSAVPLLLAVRVVRRIALTQTRGWSVRPAWHLPPTWIPRAVGVIAASIAAWGVVSLSDRWPSRTDMEVEVEDTEVPEWLLADQGDAGVVAKKMPSKKMRGQQPPPCEPVHYSINDGCWIRADYPAPCGDLYEHEGRCYVPVVEKKRAPTSVGD
jgi:hypothetical protein